MTEVAEAPKVKEEKKDELLELLRTKFLDHTLLSPPTDKKILKLKRWPYGVASELMPLALQVFSGVMSTFAQGYANMDVNTLFTINDPKTVASLQKNFGLVSHIVARTLLLCPDNGFASIEKAREYTDELETVDILAIGKIVYAQNLEAHLKNIIPAQTEETSVSADAN